MTDSADTFDRSVMMSSLIPSLKYSCSGSPLMLRNGSTQTDSFFCGSAYVDSAALFCASDRHVLAMALRRSSTPWNCSLSFDEPRLTVWNWRNPSGGFTELSATGTSLPLSRPSAASSCTQADWTDASDQRTTTASASLRARSISLVKREPP